MRKRTFIAIAITLASIPAFAESPNLLSGSTFDAPESIRNWRTQFTRSEAANDQNLTWTGIDALGALDSGSMLLTGSGAIMQCVPVTVGTAYEFGARVRIGAPPQEPPPPTVYTQVSFLTDEQCLGVSLGEAVSPSAVAFAGRFIGSGGVTQAVPAGAKSALMRVVVSPAQLLSTGQRPPDVWMDDIFLRARGGCVPDQNALCLAGDKLRVTAVYHGPNGEAINAPAIQTSHSTGYFFTDNPDVVELTAKAIDLSAAPGGGKWLLVGGLTNLQLEITVEDITDHQQKTYRNPSGRFMEPIVDLFPGQ